MKMTNRSSNAVRSPRCAASPGVCAASGCPRPGWRGSGPPGRWCRCERPTRGRRKPPQARAGRRPGQSRRVGWPSRWCWGPAGRSSPTRSGRTRSSPAHPDSSSTRCRPAARPRCCRVGWPWSPTTRWTTSTQGLAPEPDVVVVPAVAAPNGRKEAALREWLTRRADRGAHLLGVCNGGRLLAATGLLDGRRATAHWSAIKGLAAQPPPGRTGSAASAMSKTAPSPPPPG